MSNALTFPMPSALDSSADSLDQYMRTIKSFPVLTAEEELNYATRLKSSNDIEAAKALILSHLRLVASIARGYSGYGLPQADLIQEGNIGLMKAVKRFDPERGVRLVSFAVHWIKAEIHEYIVRNWRLVKIATTKAHRKLFFNLRSMKSGPGSLKPDEVAHIARELKVKPEEVLEMEARMGGHEPSEMLATLEQEHLETTGLAKALASLDERSRRVVEARWLSQNNGATLHDLADEFGVSAERIRQIEQKAMQKMKTVLGSSVALEK